MTVKPSRVQTGMTWGGVYRRQAEGVALAEGYRGEARRFNGCSPIRTAGGSLARTRPPRLITSTTRLGGALQDRFHDPAQLSLGQARSAGKA